LEQAYMSTAWTQVSGYFGSPLTPHLITSHHLLPLLINKTGGLLVEVTDGTADYNASHYRISVFYDLAKVAKPVAKPAGLTSGTGAGTAWRNCGGHYAWMASFRDDAGKLRCFRGELA
jgi:hypothetical protein